MHEGLSKQNATRYAKDAGRCCRQLASFGRLSPSANRRLADMVKRALSGQLPDAAIAMTIERLSQMKEAIEHREWQGRMIRPGDWSAPAIRSAMAAHTADSYWARDLALANGAPTEDTPREGTILMS
jgi:hypothetical protein